jgi:hypothetical protein
MIVRDGSKWSAGRGCVWFVLVFVVAIGGCQLLTSRFNELGWRLFPGDRVEMAHDLVDNHLLDRLTADEVTDRLGQPDDVDRDELTWELGATFMGAGFLHVSHDAEGRVEHVVFEDD